MSTQPVDLYVLVDASGSMSPLSRTVVEETNRLVETVGLENPHSTVTVIAFNGHEPFDVLVDRVPASRYSRLRHGDYQPGGGTPLLDALAATITRATRDAARHRGRRTAIAVITDGAENASTRYEWIDVAGKVRRRKAAGWDLFYLGAGRARADAARLGFDPADVHPWEADEAGTRAAFATIAGLTVGPRDPVPGARRRRPRPVPRVR